MFLLEALMLSLGGVAVGTAVALLAQLGLNAAHIHVPLAMQFVLMRDTLTFNANPSTVALGIAIIVAATMLVSVIPSFLAARLRPVTAMHHIG